jgi:hypothetical protein
MTELLYPTAIPENASNYLQQGPSSAMYIKMSLHRLRSPPSSPMSHLPLSVSLSLSSHSLFFCQNCPSHGSHADHCSVPLPRQIGPFSALLPALRPDHAVFPSPSPCPYLSTLLLFSHPHKAARHAPLLPNQQSLGQNWVRIPIPHEPCKGLPSPMSNHHLAPLTYYPPPYPKQARRCCTIFPLHVGDIDSL